MNARILTALPVYNEARHLAGVLSEVRRYATDILIVDDGSSDETPQLLASESDLHVVTHEVNRGYGAALASAFQFALERQFDVLVTIDCDGQHEPRLIPTIADCVFADPERPVDLVSGSRYLQQFPGDSVAPVERRLINHEVTAELNARLGLALTDAFCGFKGYRVDALAGLEITEFGYAMPLQLWVQAVCLGWSIVEFPVPLVYLDEERSFGGSLDDSRRRLAYYRSVLDREIDALRHRCDSVSSGEPI